MGHSCLERAATPWRLILRGCVFSTKVCFGLQESVLAHGPAQSALERAVLVLAEVLYLVPVGVGRAHAAHAVEQAAAKRKAAGLRGCGGRAVRSRSTLPNGAPNDDLIIRAAHLTGLSLSTTGSSRGKPTASRFESLHVLGCCKGQGQFSGALSRFTRDKTYCIRMNSKLPFHSLDLPR